MNECKQANSKQGHPCKQGRLEHVSMGICAESGAFDLNVFQSLPYARLMSQWVSEKHAFSQLESESLTWVSISPHWILFPVAAASPAPSWTRHRNFLGAGLRRSIAIQEVYGRERGNKSLFFFTAFCSTPIIHWIKHAIFGHSCTSREVDLGENRIGL